MYLFSFCIGLVLSATPNPTSTTVTTTKKPTSPTVTTTEKPTSATVTTTEKPTSATGTTTEKPTSATGTTTEKPTSTTGTTTKKPTSSDNEDENPSGIKTPVEPVLALKPCKFKDEGMTCESLVTRENGVCRLSGVKQIKFCEVPNRVVYLGAPDDRYGLSRMARLCDEGRSCSFDLGILPWMPQFLGDPNPDLHVGLFCSSTDARPDNPITIFQTDELVRVNQSEFDYLAEMLHPWPFLQTPEASKAANTCTIARGGRCDLNYPKKFFKATSNRCQMMAGKYFCDPFSGSLEFNLNNKKRPGLWLHKSFDPGYVAQKCFQDDKRSGCIIRFDNVYAKCQVLFDENEIDKADHVIRYYDFENMGFGLSLNQHWSEHVDKLHVSSQGTLSDDQVFVLHIDEFLGNYSDHFDEFASNRFYYQQLVSMYSRGHMYYFLVLAFLVGTAAYTHYIIYDLSRKALALEGRALELTARKYEMQKANKA